MLCDPERGTVAVLVAVLFGSGLLLGAAALTVDVGSINAERRQLQNGADAASLAAAQLCADGICPSASTPEIIDLANANAADANTNVQRIDPTQPAICGSDPKGVLPGCTVLSPAVTDLSECPPATIPTGAKGWVRVYTKTRMTDGTTILPYYFAQTLTGASTGSTQQTCASTAWGPVGNYGTVVPIAISVCQWELFTKPVPPSTDPVYQTAPDGTKPGYYNSPGTPVWPPSTAEQKVMIQKDDSGCLLANGHASPGGFGWVTDGSGCSLTATAGQWVNVNTGSSVKCDLTNYWHSAVMIPVFDCISGTDPPGGEPDCTNPSKGGTQTNFRIVGYASFYLSGYSFGNCGGVGTATSACEPAHWGSTCTASQACLFGWFTKGTLSDSPIGDGSGKDYGISAIQILN
jgi:hypothetical protein